MKSAKLSEMIRGWFVGDFSPSAFQTDAAEVAVKAYRAGEREEAHYHKIATEITLIQSGEVVMFNRHWQTGDIIVVEPGDSTSFEAISDTVTVVVKIPGAKNDKYLGENGSSKHA